MKSRCSICREKIDFGNTYCEKCAKEKRDRNKQTQKKKLQEADNLLKTSRWQSTRKQILIRDNYCCRLCYLRKQYVETRRLQVHHIIKRTEDISLAFSPENLTTVCPICHEELEKLPAKVQREMLQLEEVDNGLEFEL